MTHDDAKACRAAAARLRDIPTTGIDARVRGNPIACVDYRGNRRPGGPRITIELWGLTEPQAAAVLLVLAPCPHGLRNAYVCDNARGGCTAPVAPNEQGE